MKRDHFDEPVPVGVKNFDHAEQIIEEYKRLDRVEDWQSGYDNMTEGALGDF